MRETGSAVLVLAVVVVALSAALGSRAARPRDLAVARVELAGRSVQGQAVRVLERGDPDAPRRELVVGCIHGNEPAGIGIAEQLESMPLPPETSLFVVEDANPDGVRRETRTNAHGVDLNRNFPWRWRRHGAPGDPHYSGPRPLSEPESRLLARLIERVRPQITIWFHQPYGLVDESGGDVRVEKEYASLVHLPLFRLPRFPGGVTDWQNHGFPSTTAFVVELPAGPLAPGAARRFAQAALELAA